MKLSELEAQLEAEERFLAEWNDWTRVERCLMAAIEQVLAYDAALLEDGTGERSIAHRLAVYLEREFGGWHVDCEFNRQGEETDRRTKRVAQALPDLPESRDGQGTADVTPDIIVHWRRKKRNLLAIEVKPSDSGDIPKDRVKLQQYLAEPHLTYLFAVLVTYRNGRAEFLPIERIPKPGAGGLVTPTIRELCVFTEGFSKAALRTAVAVALTPHFPSEQERLDTAALVAAWLRGPEGEPPPLSEEALAAIYRHLTTHTH